MKFHFKVPADIEGNITIQLYFNNILYWDSEAGKIISSSYPREKHLRSRIHVANSSGYFKVIHELHSLNRSDTGGYHCLFRCNNCYPLSTYFHLQVTYPPQPATCSLSRHYSESNFLKLRCSFHDGYPHGTVVCFSKSNSTISSYFPFSLKLTGDTSLAVHFIREPHGSLSCCSASELYPKGYDDCLDYHHTQPTARSISLIPINPITKAQKSNGPFFDSTSQASSSTTFQPLITLTACMLLIVI